jgi:hypothetical protein
MKSHDEYCERVESNSESCCCEQRSKNRDDFIRLWTSAGPAKNYNKQAWLDVERQLLSVKAF